MMDRHVQSRNHAIELRLHVLIGAATLGGLDASLISAHGPDAVREKTAAVRYTHKKMEGRQKTMRCESRGDSKQGHQERRILTQLAL